MWLQYSGEGGAGRGTYMQISGIEIGTSRNRLAQIFLTAVLWNKDSVQQMVLDQMSVSGEQKSLF